MSGFSADWLALREPVDRRSRSAGPVGRLGGRFSAIVDLGAGTGANLRWLAPRLGREQKWILLDHDEALLAAAAETTAAWAAQHGYRCTIRRRGLRIAGAGFDADATMRAHDLSGDPGALPLPTDCLVTASALLDLVSGDWLDTLVPRLVQSAASVLWALSYDGRVAIAPAGVDDDTVVDLLNRHQLTDKGFGPALGPKAAEFARDALERAGYAVASFESPWRCGPADRRLVQALIETWTVAARETSPTQVSRIDRWSRDRLQRADAGELGVTVGHHDLVATPRPVASA